MQHGTLANKSFNWVCEKVLTNRNATILPLQTLNLNTGIDTWAAAHLFRLHGYNNKKRRTSLYAACVRHELAVLLILITESLLIYHG